MRSSNDVFLKVCGLTRLVDALHAVQQGATALGFVFWPGSPRVVNAAQAREISAALPAGITKVGVFVNESMDVVNRTVKTAGLDMVQLHGDETPEAFAHVERPVLRSVTMDRVVECAREWPGATLLLDAHDPVKRGGTGSPVDWDRAAVIARQYRVVLAGGLTPANVEEAIGSVRPYGVDVSSGVEASPGIKDSEKVSTFLANARRAFERL